MVQKTKTKFLLLRLSITTYSLFDFQTRRRYLQLKQRPFNQQFSLLKFQKKHILQSFQTLFLVLQSEHNMNIDHRYILDILLNYLHASRQGKKVNFFWIPSHIGIHSNSKADSAAKSALQFEIVKFRIPYINLKYFKNFI